MLLTFLTFCCLVNAGLAIAFIREAWKWRERAWALGYRSTPKAPPR